MRVAVSLTVALFLSVECTSAQVPVRPSRPARSDIKIDEVLSSCPSPLEVATFNSALQITFDGDPTAPTLLCTAAAGSVDLTLFKKNLYQALRVMRLLLFDVPLPWTSKPLYDWFTAAIHGIHFRTDTTSSYCCEAGGIIVIPASSTLVFAQYDKWNGDLDYFIQLMIHEARHNEGYLHTCGGQDLTISELGARGIEYYYFEWLANHSMTFLDASIAGQESSYRIFEQSNANQWRDGALFCTHPSIFAAPTSLTFDTEGVGQASVVRTVAVTTGTSTSVAVSGVSITGDNAADFVMVANTCNPASAPPSCVVLLTFTPQSIGSKNANVQIVTSSGTLSVPLAGTAVSSPVPAPDRTVPIVRPQRPPR